MLEYLQSESWQRFVHADNLLYVSVQKSLDKTIAVLGKERVEQNVQKLEKALEAVQARCGRDVVFPCSSGGKLQADNDCLLWDSGCGYDCIDRVVAELGLE